MLNRRKFLIGASLACLPARSRPAKAASGVIAGAIRWDAWHSQAYPSVRAQASLNPSAWQSRAPWFCSSVNPPAIDCNGDWQRILDLEIGYAAAAGLKYWAFDQYDPAGSDGSLSIAWKLYQSSILSSQINWCWLAVSDSLFGSTGNFSEQVAQYVTWFQQTNYQKVLTNRPLLYLFFTTFPTFGSSTSNFGAMISALRTACVGAGLGSPYVVVMSDPATAFATMQAIGADAISHYTGGIPQSVGAAYASLISTSEAYWPQYTATGASYIPTVQMGWDPRPRIQNPPPWDPSPGLDYTFPGTVAERASLLQAAVTFVNANPDACPSKAIIIYSWNECDEGGSTLVPTIGDQPSGQPPALNNMLSAIAPIVN